MRELMYGINSGLIAVVLFISMVAAVEVGYRIGVRRKASVDELSREHINSIQNAILGILALLLGFTFSLSLQRFDSRSEAVAEEANSIGTTYLRAGLLPAEIRSEVQASLRHYVDVRIKAEGMTAVDRSGGRHELLIEANHVQNAVWASALRAAEIDPNAVRTGLFIQSLNEMIDNYGRNDAAINRHVPEVVLLLLYGTFLIATGIVGFASGITGRRPSLVSYLMVALMVVLVFIILDLDRPRRGLIQVSQQSLLELQAAMEQPPVQPASH